MNNHPKISIVFGIYKEPELIIPTLEGLKSQSYKNFVVYVVDDNQPDEFIIIERAKEIILCYSDLSIQYIKNDINIGVPYVYRKWISLVNSEYFYICGAGDCLLPHALELMVGYLDAHPRSSMVHGLERFMMKNNETYEIQHPQKPTGEYSPEQYLKFHFIGGKENYGWSQASAVYRTESFKIKNIPITNYHFWDHYFHCAYLLHSTKIGFINDYIAIRHVDLNLTFWAQQNRFINRLERLIQTAKFIDEFEVQLIKNNYPIYYFKFRNSLNIIKQIGYCQRSNEFFLAARVALSDLITVFIISSIRLVTYPLVKLFSLFRKD